MCEQENNVETYKVCSLTQSMSLKLFICRSVQKKKREKRVWAPDTETYETIL